MAELIHEMDGIRASYRHAPKYLYKKYLKQEAAYVDFPSVRRWRSRWYRSVFSRATSSDWPAARNVLSMDWCTSWSGSMALNAS